MKATNFIKKFYYIERKMCKTCDRQSELSQMNWY